jgi:5-methylcytosine-specific restriction protein A
MFVQGREYRRRDLHRRYGGQRQGGISTPAEHPFIMLFTGEVGQQYGYRDAWTEDGLFLYTGEGQQGDMESIRGNRALRDHVADGKDLHLFEYTRRAYVRYVGQMICTGFHQRLGPDIGGHHRQLIIFELAPVDAFAEDHQPQAREDQPEQPIPLSVLRERALGSGGYAATPKARLTLAHERSTAVRDYVLARAGGHCEACNRPAPFRTAAGRLYLETHHIRRLSDGGPDDLEWVVALCPNCHRRAHFGHDSRLFNRQLAETIRSKEHGLSVK